MDGYYYLHANGDLIYKRALPGWEADMRESDLVRAFWPCDPTNRGSAWTILVEALAGGAKRERIDELAAKWHCDNADAQHFANYVGCRVATDSGPDDWFATPLAFKNIQESPNGWGSTAVEAMAELAKALGWKPQKLWGRTFADLLATENKKEVARG